MNPLSSLTQYTVMQIVLIYSKYLCETGVPLE